MATPVNWPTFLQQYLNADSFNIERGSTLKRTDMDVGPAKVRRFQTRSVDKYTVTINVDQSIAVQFNNFFNTTINGGATPFYFRDPFTLQMATFRIVGEISIAPIGNGLTWRVGMVWEKLP